MRLLTALSDTDELLGAQVCLYRHGRLLVDAAAGRMGPVDPRPVGSDALFQLFEAGAAVLAALALQQTTDGQLRLAAPVASVWPEFGAAGKGTITLLELLSHRIRLSDGLPPGAGMSEVCDADAMAHCVAAARAREGGAGAGSDAPWGWAMWGLLQSVSGGASVEALLADRICTPVGVPTHPATTELALAVPAGTAAAEARVAMHDASALMRRSGMDLAEVLTAPPPEAEAEAEAEAEEAEGGGEAAAGGGLQSMMGGVRGMLAPPFLNMTKLRHARLPGSSMHASARALATVYHGIGSGQLLPAELVDGLVAHREATADQPGVRWAAGFQLGLCIDSGGRVHTMLGHGSSGGAVGLCVPEAGVALAMTVSKLSPSGAATRRVVEAMLGELGLKIDHADGLLGKA